MSLVECFLGMPGWLALMIGGYAAGVFWICLCIWRAPVIDFEITEENEALGFSNKRSKP